MSRFSLDAARRSLPTIAIASALVFASATSGATAALVITGKDIKNNTVTTKDIKNGSLTTKDLRSSTVSALEGARGPAGPAGPAGPTGAVGVSGYQLVTASASVSPDSGGEVSASCPTGKRVLSAAAVLVNSYDATSVDLNTGPNTATAYTWNYDLVAHDLTIDVICAFVS